MPKPNTVYHTGKGFGEIVDHIQSNNGRLDVFIGFLRSSGMHKQKPGSKKEPETVATIAKKNEYGAGIIPERSFLRSTVNEERKKIRKMLLKLAKEIIRGNMDKKKALNLIGLYMQRAVRRKITDGVPPPNAPMTVAIKGSDHTLIDSGQMRDSVDFEVRQVKK